MNDLISIIINVYNVEDYINRCIDSIINQTYKNIEIIIVDDCSTDNTIKLIKKYKDKRIKLIHNKKNLGLSLSRNVGIDNSKGEYIYFIDADDYIANDTIEYLYNLCINNNVLLSTCDCIEGSANSYKFNDNKDEIIIDSGVDLLKKILLLNKRNGTIWNKLIHKSLFNNIRFEDRIANDVVVTYKIALELDKYVYSNIKKYYYYRHKDSIMVKHNFDREVDIYEAALERYEYINKIYPNMIENKICMCIVIISMYENKDDRIELFFNKNNIKKVYNKYYSLKSIFLPMRFKLKIKLLLYRISPRLFSKCINNYKKIKK